jgi:hypothetical protein
MLHYFPPHARCYYDASVSFGLDAKEFDERLAAIEGKVAQAGKTMSGSFGGIGKALGSLGAFLSVGAIASAAKGIIVYGARVQDLSDRFGVSTDAIQHFGNAAEKNGSSLEGMTMAFNKMEGARSKALKGDQEIINAFRGLGISVVDLLKLKPEALITKIGASSLNAADSIKIFGKNALEIRPTLAGIADGVIKFDAAISAIDIKRLKEADDTWKSTFNTIKILGARVISNAILGFQQLGDKAKWAGEQFEKASHKTFGKMSQAEIDRLSGADAIGKAVAGKVPSETHGDASKPQLKAGAPQLEKGLDDLEKKMAARINAAPLPLQKGSAYAKPRRDFSDDSVATPEAEHEARYKSGLASLREMAEQDKYGRTSEAGSAKEFDAASKSKWDAGFAAQDASSFGKGVAGMKGDQESELKKAFSTTEAKLEEIKVNTGKPFVNK